MSEVLAPEQELAQLDAVIARGVDTFREVGAALLRIRDGRLYKPAHESFESYCREKWKFTRIHANRIIGAAEALINLEEMKPMGFISDDLNLSERTLRPLVGKAPEAQKAIWDDAMDKSGGKPNGRAVSEAAQRYDEQLTKQEAKVDEVRSELDKSAAEFEARHEAALRVEPLLAKIKVIIKDAMKCGEWRDFVDSGRSIARRVAELAELFPNETNNKP